MQHLFVYGSLTPGESNAGVMADIDGHWQEATVRGELSPDGWGVTAPFPALRLDEQGKEVPGLLFSSLDLQDHWARLDAFEGSAYERVTTIARLTDGSRLEVFTYVLRE